MRVREKQMRRMVVITICCVCGIMSDRYRFPLQSQEVAGRVSLNTCQMYVFLFPNLFERFKAMTLQDMIYPKNWHKFKQSAQYSLFPDDAKHRLMRDLLELKMTK